MAQPTPPSGGDSTNGGGDSTNGGGDSTNGGGDSTNGGGEILLMVAEGILVVPHLSQCTTDGDCHKGKICDNGECKKPKRQACVQDSDCNEGQICKNGECHKQPNPNLPEAQPNLPPTCDPTTQSYHVLYTTRNLHAMVKAKIAIVEIVQKST